NIAKHPLIARPGWFSDESKRKTTPAASTSVASPNFLWMTQPPLLAVVPVRYPQVVRWTRAFWDNRRERRNPLLGKGGDAAPSSKWSRSFGGAAGVVRSTSDNRWLEPTTPSAPAKEASQHFLNGRSHPSLSKEGTAAFPPVVFNAPCPAKRCGT